MLALTVRQPWAWAIIYAGKDIENRMWRTHYRGPLLIHAGQRFDERGVAFMRARGIVLPEAFDFGGIIGRVDLVEMEHKSPSAWAAPHHFHWKLENPRPVRFRALRGRQGLFEVEETRHHVQFEAAPWSGPRGGLV